MTPTPAKANVPTPVVERPAALTPEDLVDLKNTKFRPVIDDYVKQINELLVAKVTAGELDPEDDLAISLELPVLSDTLEVVMQEVGAEFLDAGWDFSWKPVLKVGSNAVLVTLAQ